MRTRDNGVATITDAKEVVLSCVDAINAEDFKIARKYVSDDMTFKGVLGSRNGAEEYFEDMEKMKLKYNLRKTIAEGNDVCLFYDVNLSGAKVFCCGWYHVEDGKIKSLRVVFDPRPVLEASQNK